MNQTAKIAEPKHSPDGKKRGGADPATLGGRLVMQVVGAFMRSSCRLVTWPQQKRFRRICR